MQTKRTPTAAENEVSLERECMMCKKKYNVPSVPDNRVLCDVCKQLSASWGQHAKSN